MPRTWRHSGDSMVMPSRYPSSWSSIPGSVGTGAATPERALAVAEAVAAEPGLRFAGIQAYWGHLQQVMPLDERRTRVAAGTTRLKGLLQALESRGLKPGIVTGGGTGTSFLDPE